MSGLKNPLVSDHYPNQPAVIPHASDVNGQTRWQSSVQEPKSQRIVSLIIGALIAVGWVWLTFFNGR